MTVAGAEAGANPEGLRVDGGGLGACSQRIWLGVTLCEDVADNHSSPPQRLQVCPILCKVNLHHRGESLQWLYRGRNRGTEKLDNLPMLIQLVIMKGRAGT